MSAVINPHRQWPQVISDLAEEIRTMDSFRIQGTSSTYVVPQGHASERLVHAPIGIISYAPDELVLVAYAGTPVETIQQELATHRQRIRIPTLGSIGGALATTRNGYWETSNSTLPNIILGCGVISANGELFRVGAATVKNVSGFDLVKVMVGSWGLLGLVAQVTIRCEPIPQSSLWLHAQGPCNELLVESLYRPSIVARFEDRTVILLEGHPQDVSDEAKKLPGFVECAPLSDHPTPLLRSRIIVEKSSPIDQLERRLRASFDPKNKLNIQLARLLDLLT